MNTKDVITELGKHGFFEASKKTVFTGFRNTEAGEQKVEVELLDAGEDEGSTRYHCTATAIDSGKTVSGNPGSTISEVLYKVHWRELD